MAATLTALDYLERPDKHSLAPVMVVFGDERFLKRLVMNDLRGRALAGADAEFAQASFEGASTTWRDVTDELATVALFGASGRFVVIDEADDFVSRNRTELEDYVARPYKSSTLLLDVKTFPSNTRLFKSVAHSGLAVDASRPTAARLRKWIPTWSQKHYEKRLAPDALELLLELVGPEPGLLDQELAKLAAATGTEPQIQVAAVEELVGGWRSRTIWDMLDAALAGNAAAALVQLDRLLVGGENPVGLLAQISSSLRRLAAAASVVQQAEAVGRRTSLRSALEEVGVRSFVLAKSETQLRQLGRQRASKLYDWLLHADLALKGDSAGPPRLVLEELMIRMAGAPAEAARSK